MDFASSKTRVQWPKIPGVRRQRTSSRLLSRKHTRGMVYNSDNSCTITRFTRMTKKKTHIKRMKQHQEATPDGTRQCANWLLCNQSLPNSWPLCVCNGCIAAFGCGGPLASPTAPTPCPICSDTQRLHYVQPLCTHNLCIHCTRRIYIDHHRHRRCPVCRVSTIGARPLCVGIKMHITTGNGDHDDPFGP